MDEEKEAAALTKDEFAAALALLARTNNHDARFVVLHTARALRRLNDGQATSWDVGWIKEHANNLNQPAKRAENAE